MTIQGADDVRGSRDRGFQHRLILWISDHWRQIQRQIQRRAFCSGCREEVAIGRDLLIRQWPPGSNPVTPKDVRDLAQQIRRENEHMLRARLHQPEDLTRRTLRRDRRSNQEVGIEEDSHRGGWRTSSQTSSTSFSISSAEPLAFAAMPSRCWLSSDHAWSRAFPVGAAWGREAQMLTSSSAARRRPRSFSNTSLMSAGSPCVLCVNSSCMERPSNSIVAGG